MSNDHPDIANASQGIKLLKEARAHFRAAGLRSVVAKIQIALDAARAAQGQQREHHSRKGWGRK